MAVKYIPDDLIARISILRYGDSERIQIFIKEAIIEKLEKEDPQGLSV